MTAIEEPVSKLHTVFEVIFPVNPNHRPDWQNSSYKLLFFHVFRQYGPSLTLSREQLEKAVLGWLSDRRLTDVDRGDDQRHVQCMAGMDLLPGQSLITQLPPSLNPYQLSGTRFAISLGKAL